MGFRLIVEVGQGVHDPRIVATLAEIHLQGVIASNRVILRTSTWKGKRIPKLYDSGVVYEREPWGGEFEEFAGILTLLERGWGDCEDLSSWRVAELQEAGEKARIHIYWREPKKRDPKPGVFLKQATVRGRNMHVEVRRGNGDIEDPSRFLGL